jgi:hypothetical protein
LSEYLEFCQGSSKKRFHISNSSKRINGIDMKMVYESKKDYKYSEDTKLIVSYPHDYYRIHFYYHPKESVNCILTIDGFYFDVFNVIEDYYKDPKSFKLSCEPIDMYTTEGSFDYCFDKLKYFVSTIIKINKKTESTD